MAYRKGELSKAMMHRDWPFQIALPAYRCLGRNYFTIRFFCEGERLSLSPHTVHRHVANVRAKLDQPSRGAAAAAAIRAGLI